MLQRKRKSCINTANLHLGSVGALALFPAHGTLLGDLIGLALLHLLIPLLFTLTLMLPNQIRRAVLNEIRFAAQTTPFGQTVGDIHDALAVEHVAAGLEVCLVLIRLEVHERGEEQDHVAALVHDGRVAEGAAHFAGKLVLNGLFGWIVPF